MMCLGVFKLLTGTVQYLQYSSAVLETHSFFDLGYLFLVYIHMLIKKI